MRARVRAVSLAEILLSLCLVLLIVLLVLNLFPAALASLRLSGQRIQADSLAQSVLADYQARDFASLALQPDTPLADVPGRGTVFHPSLEISEVNEPGVDASRIRRLRVRVRWEDHGVQRERVREVWRTDVPR